MFVLFVLILFLFLGNSSSYIYQLNGSDYARMPPVFHLDPYDTCLHEDNDSGVYCYVQFDLVTDEPSDLYTMIKEYSDETVIHFNHTKLSHGICLTRTCKKFYKRNRTEDRVDSLEACLNDTMWKSYNLKTRVENFTCEELGEENVMNTADVLVVVLLAALIVLNLAGSVQDACFEPNKCSPFLACFSVRYNWKKLMAPVGEGSEPRLACLTSLNGIRAISSVLLIAIHSMQPFMVNCENTRFLDELLTKWHSQVLVNGPLIVQSFFVMSSFLLCYQLQIHGEKQKMRWYSVPQVIILRFMRLTPPYLVVLATTATLLRFCGSGPLWQSVVIREVEDCRRHWWYHLLYINNYVDYSNCLIQSWYLAAEFQLFCVGVFICVLTAGQRRKVLLILLFVAALLAPAVHTYLQDLDGFLVITPEIARNFFILDPTFNQTYRRGHTNLASCVIGLVVALLVYRWQTTGCKLHKCLRHRFFFWMTVPVIVSLLFLGYIFYRDSPRVSIYFRTVYAAFIRPLWGIVFGYFIIGIVFKFEGLYRGLLERAVWKIPARLSYCVYLIHITIIRILIGTTTTTIHMSFLYMLQMVTSITGMSFLAAVPLHLLVEAPFLRLTKLCVSGPRNKSDHTDNITKSTESTEKPNGTTDVDKNGNVTRV